MRSGGDQATRRAGRSRGRILGVLAASVAGLVLALSLPGISTAKHHKRHKKHHKHHKHHKKCVTGCIYRGSTSQGQTVEVMLKTSTVGATVSAGMVVDCHPGTPLTVLVEPQFGFSGSFANNSFSLTTSGVGGHGPVSRTLTGTRSGGIKGQVSGQVSVSHATDQNCTATGSATYTASYAGMK